MQPLRIALLCGAEDSETDAIISYSSRLAAALNSSISMSATVFRLIAPGRWREHSKGQRGSAGIPSGFDAYVLQYNPFSFGRRGMAPWLPLAWRRLRDHNAALMVITVHEAYMPLVGWRWTTMGLWHRAQLWALLGATDFTIATCREREDEIAALGGRHVRGDHIPVGSNLDEVVDIAHVAALRASLRGPQSLPIIATFGNAHPSRAMSMLHLALHAVAGSVGEHVLLNLGARPPRVVPPLGVEVVTPGPLTTAQVAAHLSCADLVLLPYVTGAITNKTTLMASLQMGRAVLSTYGPSTDDELLDPGLLLVSIDDPEKYAAEAVRLIRDDDEREVLARRGRELYERTFSWETIAAQTRSALSALARGSARGVGVSCAQADTFGQ
jgi:glycosyltransferase involved in cell wall biosynthesis